MPRSRPFFHAAALLAMLALLGACANLAPPPPSRTTRPAAWSEPEALVAPSSFAGVHGLAIDQKGRLLAGSVLGNTLWDCLLYTSPSPRDS